MAPTPSSGWGGWPILRVTRTLMGALRAAATCFATATPPRGRASTRMCPAQPASATAWPSRSASRIPAACRSGNGSVYSPWRMPGMYPAQTDANSQARGAQWSNDLRPVPEAAAPGVPRRHLVRLPAPAAGRTARPGARAQLAPPGLRTRAEDQGRAGTERSGTGNRRRGRHVATRVQPNPTSRTVHMPDGAWTVRLVTCDPGFMSVTDPLLVVRRHVDFLRVRSAIC